jgi:ATP-binding cassette subfamily B protein
MAALAAFFLLISSSLTLAMTGALRLAIDHGFQTRDFVLAVGVALGLAAATAGRFYFVMRLGERVVADLRCKLYAHVLTLDQSWFLTIRTGEVLSRMTADMAIVESMAGVSLSMALRNLLTMIGALVMITVVSPKLTLGVIAIVPVVLAPMFLFGRRVRRLSVDAQDRFADAVAFAGESLDQLETVQAFGREGHAEHRFFGAVENAFQASVSRIGARAIMTAMVMGLVFAGIASVLWMGAQAVKAHEITNGALLQFLFLAVLAAGSVGVLGEVWGDVQKASGAMARINELLNAKPTIAPPANPKQLPVPAHGAIAFADVHFAYPGRPDLPALNGFSLTVRPGETVALVGPSGAGKSTVLRLLLRFYDPQSGLIAVDGVNLKDADPVEVRARMALVAQDASLFSGSAADNIRFGRSDASLDDIREAAVAAEASGFVDALPQGFDQPLGERGRSLSGGQRQRLAIARALVRNAPILLLDEATSALDAENERLVQQALSKAMGGRTTLVIAHRLATVQNADRIIVMESGRVVEEGRHADLVARGGLYAHLADLQFGQNLTSTAAAEI